ncbi:MAG TPA: BamA/TamA family outer membrane protein [Fimbriimonas sp.]|nr:BamA/TamA family outer membrane protein [Fimbriimonas sp.]
MILRFAWIALLFALVSLVRAQDTGLVKDIEVHGNVRISKEAILSSVSTRIGQPYSEEKLASDRLALNDLGFFSAVDITGHVLDNGGWDVVIQVSENPVIKEITPIGNSVISNADILKVLSKNIQVGSIFNFKDADPSVRAIEKLYLDRGYFAVVTNFGPLADSSGTLGITIVEDKVGYVSVEGNHLTKDWVMKRLIKTRSGETFSVAKWRNDLRRVANTQWFESVHSQEDPNRQLGQIDLTAVVKEQKTGSINFGVQLDPESSLAGIIKYTQANLGGTGQSVDINLLETLSNTGPSVSIDYANPFIDNHDTTLRASIYSRLVYRFGNNLFNSDFLNNGKPYDERHTGATLGFVRPLSDYLSVGYALRAEYVKTENLNNLLDSLQTPNDPSDDQMTNNFIQQDGQIVNATFALTRNRRDVDLDPSRGDFLQLSFEPGYSDITHVGGLTTGTDVLGSHFWTRASADYRLYWSPDKPRGMELDAPRKVVAFRVRYSTITGTVPYFEQFFAGGSDTLRGYPDDRFWGKQSLLTNLELRYPLQKTFSLIGFIDYGGAWGGYGTIQNFTQDSSFKMHLGYGPGVSFRSPLGNIQLFLGFNENGGSQAHFLIGNSF